LHSIELRDGKAVSYASRPSSADEGVFWHADSLLALAEAGLPQRYDRFLQPEEFLGDLRVPIASHVRRVAADGARVLFSVDDGSGDGGGAGADGASASSRGGRDSEDEAFLRIGEWDTAGDLRTAQAVALERATWQHDIGVTAAHVVFIESPTRRFESGSRSGAVPYCWVPGAESWIGVVERGGDGSGVRWFSVPLCLVTHVMGAWDSHDPSRSPSPGAGETGEKARAGNATGIGIELFVCSYAAPELGQPVDLTDSVVGPGGIGLSPIGGGLAVLERWRTAGDRLERTTLDERNVEYPRIDAVLDGAAFRYGYCVETVLTASGLRAAGGTGAGGTGAGGTGAGGTAAGPGRSAPVQSLGLLRFDVLRDEVTSWQPGDGCAPSEPIFVRAADGHADDEGWLLTVVDDPNRGASDLYVLDASDFGRRRPEAVIHLPERLPFRSHGEWVPAGLYR
jgi:carotenoid cleavage dioxygenase